LQEKRTLEELSLLLQADAVVLNEDRHFNNIKFIERENGWHLAHAFDFDCYLYSCVENLSTIDDYTEPSKPFCPSHIEQVRLMYSLCPLHLKIAKFEVEDLVKGVWEERHLIGKKEVEMRLKEIRGKIK
jgi:hypothetical protein